MKYLLSIYVWIIGGLSYFILIFLVIISSLFLSKKSVFKFLSFGSRMILKLLFFRVKVTYETEFDYSKDYIFMPNHVSLLDALVLASYLPKYTNAIEADSHFRWFLYGRMLKIIEQIPINRKNIRESIKSFEIAKDRLKNHRSILVFPEGTRSRDGKMRKFKSLPFKFAKDVKVPIIPVGLIGMEKAGLETFWIKPVKVEIIYGKPIPVELIEKCNIDELKATVRERIEQMIN